MYIVYIHVRYSQRSCKGRVDKNLTTKLWSHIIYLNNTAHPYFYIPQSSKQRQAAATTITYYQKKKKRYTITGEFHIMLKSNSYMNLINVPTCCAHIQTNCV